jgi:hypothetical protein
MIVLKPEELSKKILAHASLARGTLFAGAGISARLNVPTWKNLLLKLAEVCKEFGDTASAAAINAKLDEEDYLGAAAIYRICKRIPTGERHKKFVQLLSPPIDDAALEKLRPLMEVGFTAVVTTNFDRVLHNAYAFVHRRSPLLLELDDDSLKAGAMLSEYFIGRIHGRIEKPEDVVFDEFGYEAVEKSSVYLDFLIGLLSQRPCCFIGFSFSDPAISHVLRIFVEKFGASRFPELHLAVLPTSAAPDLGAKLGSANIEVVYYDPIDGHRDLWQALRLAAESRKIASVKLVRADISLEQNFAQFKRFAAFSFAQLTTRGDQAPLIDTTKRAIVLSVLESAGPKGKEDSDYHHEVARLLHISIDTGKELFVDAVAGLVANGLVERKSGKLVLRGKLENPLDGRLAVLAQAVIDRVRVLTGLRLTASDTAPVAMIIEKIFLARAWDLAAHYAGAKIGYPADINATIERILTEEQARKRITAIKALALALTDLLQRPTDSEAVTLAEIGRSAFAVQLLMSAPRQSNFARYIIPTRVYFDSNVVMPAIVDGHPMQELYRGIIHRLLHSAKATNARIELVVAYQFVNEIVAHRELAIKTVAALSLEDPKRMRQHVALLGAHHGNVFVSAYGVHVGRAERPIKFSEFLSKVAPYQTEKELIAYLKAQGYDVVIQDPQKLDNFEKIKTLLENGYSHGGLGFGDKKEAVLVTHEAGQLAALMMEVDRGLHSLFVTADLKLTNVIYTDSYLKRLSGAIVSNMGFVGMVDLLLGVNVDSQSFSRLVWASPVTPDEVRLRDFLLQRALAAYDEALLRRMPEVLDEMVRIAKEEVDRRGIKLGESKDIAELSKVRDVLDRMENQFFERMREAMDRSDRPE